MRALVQQTQHELSTFGGMPSEVTAGGNALKFYASVCLNIKRKSQLKHGDEVLLWTCLYIVQVPYNRFFPHFRVCTLKLNEYVMACRHMEMK
jgi:recombination protein RecA